MASHFGKISFPQAIILGVENERTNLHVCTRTQRHITLSVYHLRRSDKTNVVSIHNTPSVHSPSRNPETLVA